MFPLFPSPPISSPTPLLSVLYITSCIIDLTAPTSFHILPRYSSSRCKLPYLPACATTHGVPQSSLAILSKPPRLPRQEAYLEQQAFLATINRGGPRTPVSATGTSLLAERDAKLTRLL